MEKKVTNVFAWMQEVQESVDYDFEEAKNSFAILVESLMRSEGMLQRDLAKLLDTSEASVSKLLRGDQNLTIKTMVNVARALRGRLNIHVETQWKSECSENMRPVNIFLSEKIEPMEAKWKNVLAVTFAEVPRLETESYETDMVILDNLSEHARGECAITQVH